MSTLPFLNTPLYTLLSNCSYPLYLVGGIIRDEVLRRDNTDDVANQEGRRKEVMSKDIDLVMEAPAAEVLRYVQLWQQHTGAALQCHDAFGTATLRLPDGLQVDVAMTRVEHYPHPASLPVVSTSTLHEDLYRRDFTINALACKLHAIAKIHDTDSSRQIDNLIDPFDGYGDIVKKKLRILHPQSFHDDPTRIIRGARLAGRLGFDFAEDTRARISDAYAAEVLGYLSAERRIHELMLTLEEKNPVPALRVLEEVGALESLFLLRLATDTWHYLAQLSPDAPAQSYLLLLLSDVSYGNEAPMHFFAWSQGLRKAVRYLEDTRVQQHLSPPLVHKGFQDAYGLGFAPLRYALKTLSPEIAEQVARLEARAQTRQVQGRDVLEFASDKRHIGAVLQQIAQARATGQVHDFKQELTLARKLLAEQ